MKKQFMAVAAATLMAVATIVPAFAQTGSVEVTGTAASFVGSDVTFVGFTLDGSDKVDLPGTTGVYTMTDFSGTGMGWQLQISASSIAKTGDVTKTIPLTGFDILVASLALVGDGDEAPVSVLTSAADFTATRTIATAAAGTGRGQYTFTPVFTLDVPATTYAGSYVTTITLHLNAAP